MPAFGSPGFSATKQQSQQYRTAAPSPTPQPALSMPAYAQASGAGAAQPIQPAVASTTAKPRGIIPGVGVVGGGPATLAEIRDGGRTNQRLLRERARPSPGEFGSSEYSARVMGEGRNNPQSPFYVQQLTPQQLADGEKFRTADDAARQEREREGLRRSGLSQASVDYLKQFPGGFQPSLGWSPEAAAAPSYEVYQDLAANSGGRLDPSRQAYDQRIREQQARERNARTPGARSPFFEFSDYSPSAALSGAYGQSAQQRNADALIARLG